MQCSSALRRRTCKSHNAFSLTAALRAGFHDANAKFSDGDGFLDTTEQLQERAQNAAPKHSRTMVKVRKHLWPKPPAEQPRTGDEHTHLRLSKQDQMAHLVQADSLEATLEAHRRWNREREEMKAKRERGIEVKREETNGKPEKMKAKQEGAGLSPEYKNFRPSFVAGKRLETLHAKVPGTDKTSVQVLKDEQRAKPAGTRRSFDHERMKMDMMNLGKMAAQWTKKDKLTVIPPNEFHESKKQFMYSAKMVPPIEAASGRFDLSAPWVLSEEAAKDMNAEQLLDAEMELFMQYMAPTATEKVVRQAVTEEIIAEIMNHPARQAVQAEVFGSQVSGLATGVSDIDIRLFVPDGPEAQSAGDRRSKVIAFMHDLYPKLRHSTQDFICVTVRGGPFPTISMQHRASGIDVQVVCAPDTKQSLAQTQEALDEWPHMLKVYNVVRTVLGIRHLCDVWTGGIGSYGTFMMLLASLRRRPALKDASATQQLHHFLHFYGHLDAPINGVSAATGRLYRKHHSRDLELRLQQYVDRARQRGDAVRAGQWGMCRMRMIQPYLLSLQDAVNLDNDLGRKSSAFKYIQETFKALDLRLEGSLRDGNTATERQPQRSVLASLVGRCHAVYGPRRDMIVRYAARKEERDEEASEMDGV